MDVLLQYLKAFAVGGLLCVIGQLLIDYTKLTPARILTSYVVAGVILGALGIYQPLADWAGAGITDRMKTFYAAHNEYLELLLTTGAAGLAAWLWFVIAHLRRAAQNWLRPGVAPVTLALVSYLAHAVISIRVSMIFPEIMLLFALLQVFCLPEQGDAAAEKAPAKHGKKAKPDVPADHPGLARQWLPPILAAVVMMAVCGAASRVIFGFLY